MRSQRSIHIPERSVDKRVLPNGSTLLYAPNPYNAIVAVRILSRLASRHESADKAGMANLSMKMLSAGTANRAEEEIADLLERNGAHFKAESGKDWSAVDLLTTTVFLREDLGVLIELLDGAIFPEEKLARDREIVRMSILEDEDSRLTYAMRQFSRRYFDGHPYGWPSIGRLETLDDIHRNDLAAFAYAAFDPSQLVISVVGGSSESDVLPIIEDAFANRVTRNAAPPPDPAPFSLAVRENAEVIIPRQGESEYIVMGYPGCGLLDPQAIPMRLISALLGGSMDSRLFREIREKRGLCYQVGAAYTMNQDHSPLLLYVVTSPPNRAEAIRCAEAEIRRLRDEPVPSEELERVKRYVCGTYVMAMESNMGQASRYASYEIAGLGWQYANRFANAINSITTEDLRNTADGFTHRLVTIVAPPQEELSEVDSD